MCNIAGYIGSQSASPILCRMLAAEEGFWGGYYTGIATWDGCALHSAKLTGNLARLTAETDAASLPGTVGIIHTRSKSGGGDTFAHPFLPRGEIAYVAQGNPGFFADKHDEQAALAAELFAAGYPLTSRIPTTGNTYCPLPDGTTAHMSDVMATLILSRMDRGLTPAHAMAEAFAVMPGEIVGLTISAARPDHIAYARINQPMFVAFAPHGAYLASSPSAIPEDAGEPFLLPALSAGEIYADHIVTFPLPQPPCTVAELTPSIYAAAYAQITAAIAEEGKTIPQLAMPLKELFPAADCLPYAPLCYSILTELLKRGIAQATTRLVPGITESLYAPQTVITKL